MPHFSASTVEAAADRLFGRGTWPTLRKPEEYCMMRLEKDGYSSKFIADVIFGCKFITILKDDMPAAQSTTYLDQLDRVKPSDIDFELDQCHCRLNEWFTYESLFDYYENTCVKVMRQIENGTPDKEALAILEEYLESPIAEKRECATYLKERYKQGRPDYEAKEAKEQPKARSTPYTGPGPMVRCVLNDKI
ncbi:MAG: hypothetical protein Q9174_002375 [Haloplaca sp. 1 TL-2023]